MSLSTISQLDLLSCECQQHHVTVLTRSYGGLVQIIGGIFEFACGNTFGATAFCSYGAFWMALAGTLTPSFGVLAAYTAQGVPEQELNDALGLFLIGWMIFTFIMLLASLNTSWGLICILSLLDLTVSTTRIIFLSDCSLLYWQHRTLSLPPIQLSL